MAEAVVEERAAVPKRYFCHMCNVEIDIPNTEFTCPLCAGGFVEELPPRPTTPSTSANNGTAGAGGGGARSTHGGTSSMFDLRDLQRGNFNDLEAIRGEIATLLMSRNGENVEISLDPGHGRGGNLAAPGGHLLTQSPSAGGVGGGVGGVGRTAGGRMRVATLDSLDQILMDFLNSLSGGDPIGAAGNPYNSQMFFMGNPGDYAWGREGIDTIVTQLLNQMETSGPPPLSKEKINEISTVPVSNEEIERKLQCSVCWEDFQLDEMVRKLPCSHMYHENCIVPWLKLHGTCPICRKSLDENAEDGENTDGEERSADVEMNDVSSYNDGSSEGGGGGVGGASNSSASSQQQQQQRSQARQSIHDNSRPNNVFNFEDDRNLPLD